MGEPCFHFILDLRYLLHKYTYTHICRHYYYYYYCCGWCVLEFNCICTLYYLGRRLNICLKLYYCCLLITLISLSCIWFCFCKQIISAHTHTNTRAVSWLDFWQVSRQKRREEKTSTGRSTDARAKSLPLAVSWLCGLWLFVGESIFMTLFLKLDFYAAQYLFSFWLYFV